MIRVRQGMTLIEVLVAIFVMGIGLIAILALFPIGVIRMAQAIQDSRIGNISRSAESLAIIKNIKDHNNHSPAGDAFSNPGGVPSADQNGLSYPVFIDPLGYANGGPTVAPGRPWLPRRTLVGTVLGDPYRWFTFLDDIYYSPNGDGTAPPGFEREYRYSWGYMLQRPSTRNPDIARMAVVVFKSRSEAVINQQTFPLDSCVFNLTNNTVTVPNTPQVRAGEWIMDGTRVLDGTGAVRAAHANFYRVVAVNGNDIEVQTPFQEFPLGATSANGDVIIMEGIAEVFDKGYSQR